MKTANERDLVEGFRGVVMKEGLGVGCAGQVYVADELVCRWARRVLADILALIATAFDMPTISVSQIMGLVAAVEGVEADEADEADEGEEGAEGPASL